MPTSYSYSIKQFYHRGEKEKGLFPFSCVPDAKCHISVMLCFKVEYEVLETYVLKA